MANSIGSGTSILWFRRDLRVHDHPALTAAIMASEHVLPVFVVDDALIRGRWPSPNRAWFMLESLRALDSALRERGSGLRVLRGRPAEVLPAFAAEAGVRDMYITRDYTPYARRRDKEVARALDAVGARLHARPGLLVAEPEEVATNEGRPFSVFSPFRRRWESVPPRTVLAAPERISTPADGARGSGIPTLDELGIEAPTAEIIAPGEAAARGRLEIWADSVAVPAYKVQRDRLDLDATSRLSQDLRWGLLSPVEVLSRCAGDDPGRAAYATEICWREFYYQVLWHHPRLRRAAFQIRFDALAYRESPSLLHAWQSGRTGYPVVDAAMRQLVATGWMHNRARMIVASFLTKDLLLDWRMGEAFFMRHLTDGDLASNNGGWQWAASTGTDAQPYFRIFNPTTQSTRFDPDGAYIRRWVPELAGVPSAYIHEPSTMPADVQRSSGCVMGRDYPAPIVDHAAARVRALLVYGDARNSPAQ